MVTDMLSGEGTVEARDGLSAEVFLRLSNRYCVLIDIVNYGVFSRYFRMHQLNLKCYKISQINANGLTRIIKDQTIPSEQILPMEVHQHLKMVTLLLSSPVPSL